MASLKWVMKKVYNKYVYELIALDFLILYKFFCVRKVLLIGVGNVLRGDDGVGAVVCDRIEELKITNATIIKAHQLQIELLDEMLAFDKILIVDASVGITDVIIKKVTEENIGAASSHHTDVAIFLQLAQQLYNKQIDIYTCAIPAFNFELGERLTEKTKFFAEQAIEKILQWMKF